MNEKEMKDARFEPKAEEMEITFRPQCLTCLHNRELNKCTKYDPKPDDIMLNEIKCPFHKVRNTNYKGNGKSKKK